MCTASAGLALHDGLARATDHKMLTNGAWPVTIRAATSNFKVLDDVVVGQFDQVAGAACLPSLRKRLVRREVDRSLRHLAKEDGADVRGEQFVVGQHRQREEFVGRRRRRLNPRRARPMNGDRVCSGIR